MHNNPSKMFVNLNIKSFVEFFEVLFLDFAPKFLHLISHCYLPFLIVHVFISKCGHCGALCFIFNYNNNNNNNSL